MRWDETERVHNGYVRQGWILLINPTGYIVPLARDGYNPLHPIPPRSRRRSSSSCRCTSAATQPVPRPPILLSFHKSGTRAVSFCRDELCRRVLRRWCASLLYHSHYACLRQRRYRSVVPRDVPHVPFHPSGKERRCRDMEAETEWDTSLWGTTVRRLPLSISRRWW